MPTADPKLNPKLATKLAEQLAAEIVHGHAPIHGWSVNPGLTVAPLGGRRLLVTASPLGAPRKVEQKGGGLKTQREEGTRQIGLVTPFSLSCIVPKDPVPTAKPI